MSAPSNVTSQDVTQALGVTAKELRVFLRSSSGEGLSSCDGKSHVFTKASGAAIKKSYLAWVPGTCSAKAAKAEPDEAKAS